MNHPAPLRGAPVEQVLATPRKQSTKTISTPEDHSESLGALSFIRNASVGMALIYIERLEAIWRPLAFSARHLGTYATALLHIFTPLLAAWFATHWNERIETAMWGGSALANAASFLAAWLIMLFAWSMIWLGVRAVARGAFAALSMRASSGESYLARPEASHPSGRNKRQS